MEKEKVARINELARILGGLSVTEAQRRAAEDMLAGVWFHSKGIGQKSPFRIRWSEGRNIYARSIYASSLLCKNARREAKRIIEAAKKETEAMLEEYEDKLKLYEKRKKLDRVIDRIEDKELKEMLKELI